jgi:1-deoxy-D-xylulose-5-phosphate reductoisomerase
MSAIVGAADLRPTLAAIDAGKRVAIANKEPLVMAGALLMRRAAESGARILPVDSEHSAIFQCLDGHHLDEVAGLQITGSGGPLRTTPDLSGVSVEQALDHPTWSMGRKITIDSATLMNKALEVIEARWLFGLPAERITVLVHPQSIVHSLVAFRDGSLIAQLGLPDMRVPIQYALTWPRHVASDIPPPDLAALGRLTFEAPDHRRFPTIELAREALRSGGLAPTVLNAANECAVADFLAGRCGFTGIFRILERAMQAVPPGSAEDLEAVLAADAEVRQRLAR